MQELNLLKNLKQKEILSKVDQLRKIAGKKGAGGADQMDEEYFDQVRRTTMTMAKKMTATTTDDYNKYIYGDIKR